MILAGACSAVLAAQLRERSDQTLKVDLADPLGPYGGKLIGKSGPRIQTSGSLVALAGGPSGLCEDGLIGLDAKFRG